VAESF